MQTRHFLHILHKGRWVIKIKAYIDLDKICANICEIRRKTGGKLMLMAKADAYGHGLKKVAKATQGKVDMLGVATLEEGLAVKRAKVTTPTLLLIPSAGEIERAVGAGLEVAISNEEQLKALENLKEKGATLHIAVDSGMHRLGFSTSDLENVIKRAQAKGFCIGGVYSHLRAQSKAQICEFEKAANIARNLCPKALLHIASSHSLSNVHLRYDMVRVGISAYEGAMRVESQVISARRVEKGEHISYGNFKLESVANTAVVFGGYADGVRRECPSSVTIRNRVCNVIGKVCMDMFIVETGDFLAEVGERVVLMDSAKQVAKERRSIPYTAMTCWQGRVQRIYDKGRSKE